KSNFHGTTPSLASLARTVSRRTLPIAPASRTTSSPAFRHPSTDADPAPTRPIRRRRYVDGKPIERRSCGQKLRHSNLPPERRRVPEPAESDGDRAGEECLLPGRLPGWREGN